MLLNLGGVGTLIVALVYFGPQIRSIFKRDKLDNEVMSAQIVMVDGIAESYAKKFKTQEDWQEKTDAKLAEMDRTIHKQSVRITRLTVVMLRLEGELKALGGGIAPDLVLEIDALRDGP
jgi:hypothetical protein